MKILENGVAVTGTTHHAIWAAEKGLVHEELLSGTIKEHVRKGSVFVDAGAHIGSLTRVALDQGAIVYAFEPSPDSFACLRHNCPEAFSFCVALSHEIQIHPFVIDEYNAGASYLSGGKGEQIVVPALTLDSLQLSHVDFIKIDVEGCELRVLKGAAATIVRDKPKLLIEVNQGALQRQHALPSEIFSWLLTHSYDWKVLQPQATHSHRQYDVLAWEQE